MFGAKLKYALDLIRYVNLKELMKKIATAGTAAFLLYAGTQSAAAEDLRVLPLAPSINASATVTLVGITTQDDLHLPPSCPDDAVLGDDRCPVHSLIPDAMRGSDKPPSRSAPVVVKPTPPQPPGAKQQEAAPREAKPCEKALSTTAS